MKNTLLSHVKSCVYVFDRYAHNNVPIHSFIRKYFKDDLKKVRDCDISAGFQDESLFVVLSNVKPKDNVGLLELYDVDDNDCKYGDIVFVRCRFCLCNRHRRNHETGKYSSDNYTEEEAYKDFKKKSGLDDVNGDKTKFNEKPFFRKENYVKEKKFPINNIFTIYGRMMIEDVDVFKKALHFGIGSRRSYGFGVLFVDFMCNSTMGDRYDSLKMDLE